ncbi:MAG TPA: nuclear transport factor 2 family protein [Acidimicrobiales bacterium]|nr:nuclear transport factor 2 family protein [Acidimicrobiales bacterium]
MAEVEARTRQFIDAINQRDWQTVAALVTPTTVHRYTGGEATGADGIIGLYTMLCEQMGWKITVNAMTSAGDWVATLHTNTFTDGAFEVCTSGRFDGDRVAELWTVGMPPLS